MCVWRRSYLVQNAVDRVFLPRSPIPSLFSGSDLVLQCRTCFQWLNVLHAMVTSFSGCSYLALHANYDVSTKPGQATILVSIQQDKSRCSYIYICLYICVCVSCMYACTHVRMYVCMYVCLSVCMYVSCIYNIHVWHMLLPVPYYTQMFNHTSDGEAFAFQGGSCTISHQQSRQAATIFLQSQVGIQLKDRILGCGDHKNPNWASQGDRSI